VEVLGDGFE